MNQEVLTPEEAQGGSSGGCLKGCLIVGVSGIVLLLAGIFAAYLWLSGYVDDKAKVYEDKGFQRQGTWSQFLQLQNDITGKHLYVGQIVRLQGNVDNDIAFIAQIVEVYGEVKGDIHFTGQQLMIKSTAKIHGNVEVQFAQQIMHDGTIEGEVRGDYQMLMDPHGNYVIPGQKTAGEGEADDSSTPSDNATAEEKK
ncbi:MAG: polymer-forming cytoskeletal protein [Planctomycetota bacterium]